LYEQIVDQLDREGIKAQVLKYGPNRYAFPADIDDADGDAIDAIAANNIPLALPRLLGPRQWALFKATKPKMPQYRELFDLWNTSGIVDGSAGE
jgi:hypothetical protein